MASPCVAKQIKPVAAILNFPLVRSDTSAIVDYGGLALPIQQLEPTSLILMILVLIHPTAMLVHTVLQHVASPTNHP